DAAARHSRQPAPGKSVSTLGSGAIATPMRPAFDPMVALSSCTACWGGEAQPLTKMANAARVNPKRDFIDGSLLRPPPSIRGGREGNRKLHGRDRGQPRFPPFRGDHE